MKQLKIKDNNKYADEKSFSDIPRIMEKVADITIGKLQEQGVFVFTGQGGETEDLSKKKKILTKIGKNKYRSGNIMGFIGCGDERLVIESRFAEDNDYFLTYLLSKAMDFPNSVELQTGFNQDINELEYFLFLFPHLLKKAIRKGVYKTYIRNHYNDANVKGTIDVARHISKNTPFQGKIAYSQREYSYDNDLLELIRHTIEFIRQKPYGKMILAKAKDEVKMVIEITQSYNIRDRKKIIDNNRKNIIRHAYYHEYRELQHLCVLILQHEKLQIGMGDKKIYGILFDGSWLWEEYVNTLISDLFYHPMNKKGTGAQYLFAGNNGLIYPDFISREKHPRMIADAKYKPQENIGKKGNEEYDDEGNKDYFQVLSYMFRFDAKIGYFLYPESEKKIPQKLYLNKGLTYEENVDKRNDAYLVKLGLKIPRVEKDNDKSGEEKKKSYDEFVSKIQDNEKEFREEILKEFKRR